MAGRWMQLTDPDQLALQPYLEYRHGDSREPRLQHLAWDGLTLPADDPWWDTHYPPNGWGCKCKVFAAGPRDLARAGKSGPDTAPPVEIDPKTGAPGGDRQGLGVQRGPGRYGGAAMSDGFSVRVEDNDIQKALAGALRATGDLSQAMKAIGEHMLRSTDDNFAGEHDPDGRPWKPTKVLSYYLAYTIGRQKKAYTKSGSLTKAFSRYLGGRKILTDSGELRGSIHYRAGRNSVAWGSGKQYAAIHQFGGKAGRNRKVTIPARPSLGMGRADRQEALDVVADYLVSSMSKN